MQVVPVVRVVTDPYLCWVLLGRLAGWLAVWVAAPAFAGLLLGRWWVPVAIALLIVASLTVLLWLPRTAHAAFEAGRHARAARRYRVIAATAVTAARERAAVLSRTGCDVATGKHAAAERVLARWTETDLDAAERVTWFNNRACIALETGGDPQGALALVDQAVALRPDVPAVQHTRAMALIAVGRIDDAIAVLDGMRAGGELSPQLEALRCRDLAVAWDRKGQADYAADYRERARMIAR